ncbi:MAG: cupin domain-containing protein [Solirubrobacterales bacterium]
MSSEPLVLFMPGGVRTEIHLNGEDTGGFFCLLVDEPPPGWSLPAHLHAEAAETIHVVAGEFEMTIAGEVERIGAGETVHIPPGVVHSGANVGAETGRRLLTFSPAGMEDFFLEAGTRTPEAEVDRRAALAAARRHGWEFVD